MGGRWGWGGENLLLRLWVMEWVSESVLFWFICLLGGSRGLGWEYFGRMRGFSCSGGGTGGIGRAWMEEEHSWVFEF